MDNKKIGLLTTKTDVPFVLKFKSPLEKSFTFKEMNQQNNKDFQNFLNKISRMTVQEVDKLFVRPPDKEDIVNGKQVIHYAVTDKFRIHVVMDNDGYFEVIRMDPNHKFHP